MRRPIALFVIIFPWCISAAYKHADGKKIDGKRVLVDVERARTVKGWLPRRLGTYLQPDATPLARSPSDARSELRGGRGVGGGRCVEGEPQRDGGRGVSGEPQDSSARTNVDSNKDM